jgi:hypothetical protein
LASCLMTASWPLNEYSGRVKKTRRYLIFDC